MKLSNIAKISTGFPFDGNKYGVEGIRVVRGENIGNDVFHWEPRVDKRWHGNFEQSEKYSLCTNDIVMQMDGNIGKNMVRVTTELLPLYIAQRVACIRAKDDNNQDYIYYVLKSSPFQKYIKSHTTGTSIQHISLKQIGDFEFDFAAPRIQLNIANILRSIDDKITLNRAINQNLEALAKQLYDYWFVQFDFPNEDGKPYKSSGGAMMWNDALKREIPKGWEVTNIGGILDKVISTPRLSTDEYLSNGTYPVIDQTTDVYYAGFTNNKDAVVYQFPAVVFGDHSCAVKFVNFPFVRGADGTQVMLSKYANISVEYLYFVVNGIKIGKGYARHYSFLKEQPIIVPPQKEAKKFEGMAHILFEQITRNRKEILSLATQRDEILPLLMNGQVSVMPLNSDLSHD